MLWLLDTNIISEAWKPSPDPAVIAFMAAQKDECAISEICFSELYYGLHRLPFGKRRNDLERHIQFLRQDYEETILVFGAAEAYSWGEYAAELFASRGKAYFTARSIRDSAI